MATLLPEGKQSFTTNGSLPLAGGKVYTYEPGTSTPKDTYTTSAASVANANPVILDSRGEATIFWSGAYDVILKTSADVTIWGPIRHETPEISGSAAAVLTDLASTSDAAKGDALVGVKRTESGSVATTQHAVNQARAWFPVPDSGATGDGVADDTAELQAACNSSLYVDLGGKSYLISGKIDLRSGHRIIGNGATITQTLADTVPGTTNCEIFNVVAKSNIEIEGVNFVGVGTDLAENDNSHAVAIYSGTSGSNFRIHNCKFTGFTYASMRCRSISHVWFTNNYVEGPGSPELTAGVSGKCYGFLSDAGCTDIHVHGNYFTKTAQGALFQQTLRFSLIGNDVYDIVGQHGFYLAAGLLDGVVSGNRITNIDLQGIKLQAEPSVSDSRRIVISNNTVADCGSHGILCQHGNGSTPQTEKNRGVSITGNAIRSVTGSAINVQNTIGCVIENNIIDAPGESGVFMSAASRVRILGNVIENSVLSGIRDSSACTHIYIGQNTLIDVASASTAGDKFGIFIGSAGSEFDIVGNKISDANAKMQYAIYFAADINATSTVCDNIVVNATDAALRLSATTAMRKYKGNSWAGTLGLTFNDPVLPAVASAGTITLPTAHDTISITGTTAITSINSAGHSGHTVTLVFTGALTLTNGSNLKLGANFVTTADDAIVLTCDGTNWYRAAAGVAN
jgi:hypothetical protein